MNAPVQGINSLRVAYHLVLVYNEHGNIKTDTRIDDRQFKGGWKRKGERGRATTRQCEIENGFIFKICHYVCRFNKQLHKSATVYVSNLHDNSSLGLSLGPVPVPGPGSKTLVPSAFFFLYSLSSFLYSRVDNRYVKQRQRNNDRGGQCLGKY